MRALLLYHTKTGHTLEAAEAIAKGITSAGSMVQLVPAKEFLPSQMADYNMLIVGSPCWGGSMGAGISGPIQKALNGLSTEVKGKTCAGFSVNGGKGGLNTVRAMGAILNGKGCAKYISGPVAKAGAPLSLWKGPAVTEKDLLGYETFGIELAKNA
jgi:flavodoxin